MILILCLIEFLRPNIFPRGPSLKLRPNRGHTLGRVFLKGDFIGS